MWICINMYKIRLFHWLALEIHLIKKSCNLIGWEHFDPYLRNKNFPKYGICAGTQQSNINFHYRTNSEKINDKFFNKFQKPCLWLVFWSIFLISGAKKFLQENLALSCTTSNGFLEPCQNLEKMIQFHKNTWTDRRMDGRTEWWTELIS